MFEDVQRRLQQAGLAHAVFGSAVGSLYGLQRPAADIDVLVRADSLASLQRLVPGAQPVAANGLRLDEVELWLAPLVLPALDRCFELPFDDALAAHCLRHPRFGAVLSREDQLILKATLQRQSPDKDDVADARALLQAAGPQLDVAYLAWRAAQCGVVERVRPLLRELLP